jgi:RecB family exonuclease
MSSFLGALAALCGQHPLREKIVVVSSLAIGHQIGDAIARAGTPWINLRFETTRTIADAVAGLALAKEGKSVVSRAQALALIERACDRVLDDTSYFAALRESPGLHRAMQRSVDDLRLAGIRAALPSEAFEERRKAADLARVVDAYEEELRERDLIDRSGVVMRAIALLEEGAAPPWSADAIWVTSDDVELPHEESRLVALASRGSAIARTLGTPEPATPMPHLASVNFVRAAGEENEVREVFRAITADGQRVDEAELIYTSATPYLPLIFELTAEYGIEATFAEGVAVPFTSPGQACLAYLRWCGEGWQSMDLELAARAGVLRTDDFTTDEGEKVPPATIARILAAASIGWGRDRYEPQLETYIAARELEAGDEERSEAERAYRRSDAMRGRAVLRLVRRLLETDAACRVSHEPVGADDPKDELIRSTALARAADEFVRTFAHRATERDAMAQAALRRMFDELAQLPDSEVPRAESAFRLAEAVRALHTAASNPRPGHLHVTTFRSAAWIGMRRLFVVGLSESHYPGKGIQDPIVLDAERERLNSAITPRQLALRGEAPLRVSVGLRRCLRRAIDAEWTISFPSIELLTQRESFPANDLLDIFRAACNNSAATYDDLMAQAQVAGFIDATTPLDASEWWLAQRLITNRADYRGALLQEYRWLARGAEAEAARNSQQLTRWDGAIEIDPARIDPRLNGRVLSASQIESMASCPYGWFLRRVLKIEPPRVLKMDPDVWLDPMQRGSLLHEIFEDALTTICETSDHPSVAAHLPVVREIAEEKLLAWRGTIPPPNEHAYRRGHDEVLQVCEAFLRLEEARTDARPMYFEAPFGFADAADHPAGMVEPLTIDLGADRSIRLRGRIDRIDQTESGRWRIWDYKTGSRYKFEGEWTFDKGRKVQHAIYARAAEQMLRSRGIDDNPVIESSGYLFPTPKGGGEPIAKLCAPGELESVLNQTFDLIASGFFAHPEKADECRFCDFAEVCGGAEAGAARAASKTAANEALPQVLSWRRLQDVG